jgi:hypothetical protein
LATFILYRIYSFSFLVELICGRKWPFFSHIPQGIEVAHCVILVSIEIANVSSNVDADQSAHIVTYLKKSELENVIVTMLRAKDLTRLFNISCMGPQMHRYVALDRSLAVATFNGGGGSFCNSFATDTIGI